MPFFTVGEDEDSKKTLTKLKEKLSISLAYGVILVKEQFDDFIDHLRDNCSTEEDHEIKGIFNAIETFLDANCDKETNLKCLLVLQKLIKPIANPKSFSPDLTKSLITTLRKSIDILSDTDLKKFEFERGNVKKFAIGFFKLQSNFQRFNRDLQIEFLNFLVKLAQCDPKGNWAFLKYQLYELCSHNDDRLGTIHILRKHFYNTKLNLSFKFFKKLGFFVNIPSY